VYAYLIPNYFPNTFLLFFHEIGIHEKNLFVIYNKMKCDCGKTEWISLPKTPFYIKKNTKSGCTCKLDKCPNYPICGVRNPTYLFIGKDGVCLECNLVFDKRLLKDKKRTQCLVCTEEKHLYQLPICDHKLCKDCIKNIFYNDYGNPKDYPEYTEFPYKPIGEYGEKDYYHPEEDYESNPYNEKWINDELVQIFEEWKNVYNEHADSVFQPANGKKCPYCRTKI
jgi:hypothetical protein